MIVLAHGIGGLALDYGRGTFAAACVAVVILWVVFGAWLLGPDRRERRS